MAPKKQPVRMCAGCGEHKEKRELTRVVRSPEGAISLDPTGRAPGRGVYICASADCLKKARKSRRLEKALSAGIPDEVYERLEKELS